MAKFILKGAHISNAVNVWSRHATPEPACHLILDGPNPRQFYHAIDPAATGLFIFGHPTLGVTLPALWKTPEGGVLHQFFGVTPQFPTAQVDGSIESWLSRNVYEIYVGGLMKAYVNGTTRDGKPFVAISMKGAQTFIDAIKPAAIVWKTGDSWADVPDRFKNQQGGPIVDPDDVERDITEVSYTEPIVLP